jgi:hypothetical protein
VRLLKRFLQRLVIFGLGIFSVWFIVFVVFETADRRLPWILALGITYGFAAYVVLPRVIRLGLKILQRKRVPSYTITGDGLPGDPVNVALEVRYWNVHLEEPPKRDVTVELRLRQTPGQSWAKLSLTSPEWEPLQRCPIFLDWTKLGPINESPAEIIEK